MWGYDLRSGEWRDCPVSYHASLAYDDLIVTVGSGGAEVRSTFEHPYWVVAGEELDARPVLAQLGDQLVSVAGVAGRWVDAGHLRAGDVLLSRGGGLATVESVETAHTPTTVYHIYVEDVHNYAVGHHEWLVHNGHRDGQGKLRSSNGQFEYDGRPAGGGLGRPSLRAGTKRAIEDAARRRAGQFLDGDGRAINNPVYGHKPGLENRRILEAGRRMGLSQGQVNDFVNGHPHYFQMQDGPDNLAHLGEMPGKDQLDDILDDMRIFFNL